MEKFLEAIKGNPAITYGELTKATSLSTRGVEWKIAKLKAEGKIKRIGPDKGGHWEVIDES
ncbi:winged helix-turn-helix transcriptional regulator [uncultured Methanomethylovorans sp.]|uniref:winged helix-turn-helix transcriptional regulator n=1 Tax=uncultured Methanomethylovorans sp. TaxID=183759 RepID=UPI00260E9D40|nr:winged helix-turn-helix transcriptional regulator [uncultured Methanomethylovorans sp.]